VKIHNELPRLLDCIRAWPAVPSEAEFRRLYLDPLEPLLSPMLEDFGKYGRPGLYAALTGLAWDEYRAEALTLDPEREQQRLARSITRVEQILGLPLEGDAVLFGAFTLMDGYARFDRGGHRVFLGVDESHARGAYLDVLITHELTHVARESRGCVWEGWGLDPRMTHDDFTRSQPVVEHLFSEGFSCLVSELLNPDEPPWTFAYQDEDSLARILEHGPALDRVIRAELSNPKGRYGSLYDTTRYVPEMPRFAHYVWAWKWVRRLFEERGSDPKVLLPLCSKELVEHAKAFELK
jgi:hypothetical protein